MRPEIPRAVRRELEERAEGRCEVCSVRLLTPAQREGRSAENREDGRWSPWARAARSFADHLTSESRGKISSAIYCSFARRAIKAATKPKGRHHGSCTSSRNEKPLDGAEAGARIGVRVAAHASADHLDDRSRARSDHRRQTAQVTRSRRTLRVMSALSQVRLVGASRVQSKYL